MLLRPDFDLTANTSDHSMHRALYRIGRDIVRDLVLLNWATELSIAPGHDARHNAAWIGRLDLADQWKIPGFPLTGRDARALGLTQGPEIGRLLAQVERWWEDGDYSADRKACLARLKELVESAAES
jgi:poly(A) polymerase